jgi:hypothetical protein
VRHLSQPAFFSLHKHRSQAMKDGLTPPVDTAEFDDHVPSKLVTLLVSVRSPCAMTDVERSAEIAIETRVNMVACGLLMLMSE